MYLGTYNQHRRLNHLSKSMKWFRYPPPAPEQLKSKPRKMYLPNPFVLATFRELNAYENNILLVFI